MDIRKTIAARLLPDRLLLNRSTIETIFRLGAFVHPTEQRDSQNRGNMKCVAYMWSSLDCYGNQFLLCLSPLLSVAGGIPTEAFRDKTSLALRLVDIGCTRHSINRNISNLGTQADNTWSSLEVDPRVFESFGRLGSNL